MERDRTAPVTTRRRLLQGAALAAVPFALLPGTSAAAQSRTGARPGAGAGAGPGSGPRLGPGAGRRAVDYPTVEWQPASASNYSRSSRPTSYPVDYVVVHVTQETYADTLSIFRDPAKQVSAHYVVRSSDGHVAQCVRETDIAWHAGNWDYNTRSIGIEHEGWVDRPEYFTDAMYQQSARLTAAICTTYGIPKDREHIIAHHEVPGSDHTDPGPLWDWTRYIRLVNFA
ncbi:N-acetylmuramoyl-L-alanine amidase [Streptomyces mutabilis]|uniref:N-acetylmuramoyl-L-alanine amidase n=1 Tax=Streptomyces mutabilis TaxID=67332 RepID=UPI000A252401|nr:N-acetylmuramoyl-L-alanine amidase [Streptomyces sp. 4F]